MENSTHIFKAILKADLTKSKNEFKIILFFLESKDKKILLSNKELAEKLGITHSNLLRSVKKLLKNKVLGKREVNGQSYLYLRSFNSWKSEDEKQNNH